MELSIGTDFEEYLRNIEARGHRLTIRELVDAHGAGRATRCEVAHNAGILHRDIKPGNIFVLNDGRVRLLDFGFAKFTRMRGLTLAGIVAGSPSYIAPEAWKGDPSLLDHRIDIYGLAAVIFRALAGKPPFLVGELIELLQDGHDRQAPEPARAAPGSAARGGRLGPSRRWRSNPTIASCACAACGSRSGSSG